MCFDSRRLVELVGDMVGLASVEDAELRRELVGEATGEAKEMATADCAPPVRTDIETGRDVEGVVRDASRAAADEDVDGVVRTGRVGGEWTGEPRGDVGEEVVVVVTTTMEAGALWSTLALMWEKSCLKDWIFFSEGLGL